METIPIELRYGDGHWSGLEENGHTDPEDV